MEVSLRTVGFRSTSAITSFVNEQVGNAVGRLGHLVSSVSVTLRDENGPKGGIDKVCKVQVVLAQKGRIVIEERGDDIYKSIALAAHRVSAVISRKKEQIKSSFLRRRGASLMRLDYLT